MPSRASARASGAARPPPALSALPALTIAELLTGWLSSARGVRPTQAFSDCDDYVRHVTATCRARSHADALCERLGACVADWVDRESHNDARPSNRLTPTG